MTIVVDTNVLVSGLLNPRGAPGRIVDLVIAGEVDLNEHRQRFAAVFNASTFKPLSQVLRIN